MTVGIAHLKYNTMAPKHQKAAAALARAARAQKIPNSNDNIMDSELPPTDSDSDSDIECTDSRPSGNGNTE
jgi:hypothetical protein